MSKSRCRKCAHPRPAMPVPTMARRVMGYRGTAAGAAVLMRWDPWGGSGSPHTIRPWGRAGCIMGGSWRASRAAGISGDPRAVPDPCFGKALRGPVVPGQVGAVALEYVIVVLPGQVVALPRAIGIEVLARDLQDVPKTEDLAELLDARAKLLRDAYEFKVLDRLVRQVAAGFVSHPLEVGKLPQAELSLVQRPAAVVAHVGRPQEMLVV